MCVILYYSLLSQRLLVLTYCLASCLRLDHVLPATLELGFLSTQELPLTGWATGQLICLAVTFLIFVETAC